jgi:3-(methylthio)propionyl---CoA ligase
MRGLMQDHPLLISSLLQHAEANHRQAGVITAVLGAPNIRHTWPEIAARSAKLANALKRLGIKPGDRIATMAWNDHRHVELYFAISGLGAICHTINPRLFADQIRYIIRHAADRWLFIDPTLLPALEPVFPHLEGSLEGVFVMSPDVPATPLAAATDLVAYEHLLAAEPDTIDWPIFDENTASSLCYTSGTTGNPKGVLYSHRSTLLHAWSIALPDMVGMRSVDVVLPIVPMFHVNAWGIPYAAALTGATLAMPGPHLDGSSLHALMSDENVTYAAGVPTVWLGLLQHLRATGGRLPKNLRGLVGGSALPQSLAETYEMEFGVRLEHGWGMTEMSPVGAYNAPKPENQNITPRQYLTHHVRKQGRAPFGVEMKIIDPAGNALPHDGRTQGELCVRGPWITSGYYEAPVEDNDTAFTIDGWFRTGDVVTIDESGYMHIVDRVKDLIKSGGEWISSIELENLTLAIPGIREAAAVPARHPKWDERPILIVAREEGTNVTEAEVRNVLSTQLKSWMLPDAVVFVDDLPHTATGKILKRKLREDYADYLIDNPKGEPTRE